MGAILVPGNGYVSPGKCPARQDQLSYLFLTAGGPDAMAHKLQSVMLPNGVELCYVEQGDSSGTPMLMLHGVTDSWRAFEPILPHLPESIHVFAVTQRGHGDSSRPDGYRTRDFAADVGEFVDALELAPVVIVGHSMGTINALRFAIDRPRDVQGLVLGGAFAAFRSNPDLVEFCAAVSALEDPINPEFVRTFQQDTLARPVPEAFFETVVAESLKVPAHVWRAAFAGFLEDDFANELDKVSAPTLLLWGAHDAFSPRSDQDTLTSILPHARLVVYEDAGHALHWEEPERFAGDIAAFTESLS
jgi:non-heme chloroperoxidase